MVAGCDFKAARSWHVVRHTKKKHPERSEVVSQKSVPATLSFNIQKKSRKSRVANGEKSKSHPTQPFTLDFAKILQGPDGRSDPKSDAKQEEAVQVIMFPTVATGSMAMVALPWELPMDWQVGDRGDDQTMVN
jgi:hypothetical protein